MADIQRFPAQASMGRERRWSLEPNQESERRPTTHQEPEATMGTEKRRTLEPNQEAERRPTTHQEQEAAMGRTRRRSLEPNQEPERRPTTHQEQQKRRRPTQCAMGKKKRRTHKHSQESEHLPGAATNHSNVARSMGADAPSFSNAGHHPHAPNVSPVGSDQSMPPPPPPAPAPTKDVTWAAASSHSSVAPSVNQPSGLPSVNQSGGSSTLVVPLTLSGIPITGGVVVAQAIYFPVSNIEFGGSGSTAPRQDAVNSGPSSNPAMAGSGIQGLHLHTAGGSQHGEMGGSNGADATSNGAAQPHDCQNRST